MEVGIWMIAGWISGKIDISSTVTPLCYRTFAPATAECRWASAAAAAHGSPSLPAGPERILFGLRYDGIKSVIDNDLRCLCNVKSLKRVLCILWLVGCFFFKTVSTDSYRFAWSSYCEQRPVVDRIKFGKSVPDRYYEATVILTRLSSYCATRSSSSRASRSRAIRSRVTFSSSCNELLP